MNIETKAQENSSVSEEILKQKEKKRFLIELEFVIMLSSVDYLVWLTNEGYFDKPEFLRYIDYLQYWSTPEYVRYVTFPEALYFLKQIQDPDFRTSLKDPNFIFFLRNQQNFHWRYYKQNEQKLSFDPTLNKKEESTDEPVQVVLVNESHDQSMEIQENGYIPSDQN
ncbi:hypothetical protein WA158_006532 [Blastocystis sp. Blastoise]